MRNKRKRAVRALQRALDDGRVFIPKGAKVQVVGTGAVLPVCDWCGQPMDASGDNSQARCACGLT